MEIPRKNLPLKMGEKNLNKDFSNTRGGGVTILRKFFSKFLFFKMMASLREDIRIRKKFKFGVTLDTFFL